MAKVKPLRLKSAVAPAAARPSAEYSPIAEVIADNGIYHLDQRFDYLVPESLSDMCTPGSRVQVPFNGREIEAFIVARKESGSQPKLKEISKVITPISLLSAQALLLIEMVAKDFAAHPFDVLRFAIPPRVASVEKRQWLPLEKKIGDRHVKPEFIQLPPSANPFLRMSEYLKKVSDEGSVLVIVPDVRSIERFISHNRSAIILDSSQERTTRYENYLKIKCNRSQLIVGTRSAIFADIPDLSTIMIFDEGSEQYYEPRTPGWNVRDVALLRRTLEKVKIIFLGYSPSSEVARSIELEECDFKATRARLVVEGFAPEYSELLPGRLIARVRKALESGPVLFIAPRKGYAQGILCSHCRNVALCECGFKFARASASAPITCTMCDKVSAEWSCLWCKGKTPFLISRGSARFAHEIGLAFPKVTIISSEGDHIQDDASISSGIVIATPGSAPYAPSGYSAVIFLEGESLLSQTDLRAQERARNIFFTHAALVVQSGVIYAVLGNGHPMIGSLASWKPSLLTSRELREREDVLLPPFSRAVSLDILASESAQLVRALEVARTEGRLPAHCRILGPTRRKNGDDRVLILAPISDGDSLISLIHEYQRRRSISKKPLASLRIDPYSLIG